MAKSLTQEFVKGLWDEVPPFRLVLGLCPVLAVTKSVENGIGMGLATTFVLVGSNVLVSSCGKSSHRKFELPVILLLSPHLSRLWNFSCRHSYMDCF